MENMDSWNFFVNKAKTITSLTWTCMGNSYISAQIYINDACIFFNIISGLN